MLLHLRIDLKNHLAARACQPSIAGGVAKDSGRKVDRDRRNVDLVLCDISKVAVYDQ